MKIAVIKERRQFEERVSCTPEIVKKFINLGFKVSVQSEAGISSSYFDSDYKSSGAEVVKSEKTLLSDADLIFAIVRPDIKLLKLFKKGSILICQMETYINSNELKDIAKNVGPKKYFISLGYAGWAPGQLEQEIINNSWININEKLDLIFDIDAEKKWEKAIKVTGIDFSKYSSLSGRA